MTFNFIFPLRPEGNVDVIGCGLHRIYVSISAPQKWWSDWQHGVWVLDWGDECCTRKSLTFVVLERTHAVVMVSNVSAEWSATCSRQVSPNSRLTLKKDHAVLCNIHNSSISNMSMWIRIGRDNHNILNPVFSLYVRVLGQVTRHSKVTASLLPQLTLLAVATITWRLVIPLLNTAFRQSVP